MKILEQRFWEKVDKTSGQGPDGDCWIWTAARDGQEYGQIRIDKKAKLAHRVSYSFAHPTKKMDGLCVCHHCDTPLCVNPSHLFLGTKSDNMRDCARKGRTKSLDTYLRGDDHPARKTPEYLKRGEDQHLAQLSEEKVKKIRGSSGSLRDFAEEYGVSKQTIWRARTRKTWAHVI